MKVLGAKQFHQKKFKLLGIEGKFYGLLGDLPKGFIGIVYGKSGNGKTELCLQMAKYFTKFDKVAWLSYEQGHGYDLQKGVVRNDLHTESGKFLVIDPKLDLEQSNRPPNDVFFDDLWQFLDRRKSPRFVFVDSVDYTRFTLDQYFKLKERFEKTHCIIFISHCKNNEPETKVGQKIEYDGAFGILVKKFIANPKKNRYGGTKDYIIYEPKARELNPLYFSKLEAADTNNQPKKRGRKPKTQA